ncbi:MAG TPA: adenylyltransferase/cytidyltransferase family protein [Candidatus Saccharimonadia bacterium]|nr:adenylyltransferase/cytidyltransferase family protein [Candidatus Saccharimonadia bacterium]
MLLSTPSYQQLVKRAKQLREAGMTVVLATGIFDLFHAEHENYLRKAKAAGNLLIVAIESDIRARALKGEGRPIHTQEQRLNTISGLAYVDHAFILPEDFNTQEKYEQLIAELLPNIYAVSSHSAFLDNKRMLVEKYGGTLKIVHEHNPEISTTKLAEENTHSSAA